MKIQCDVCNKEGASVFCVADEAALCSTCDHRVHHANKLAGKHQRFSLLLPSSPKQFPLCDICQEKRAFLFCQQDRAILCRDCDFPIHKANEHTQNHNRFLLTGVKLSANSAVYSFQSPSDTSLTTVDSAPPPKSQNSRKPISVPAVAAIPNTDTIPKTTTVMAAATTDKAVFGGDNHLVGGGIGLTSSISEYLIEMLPGWRVDDFLDSSAPTLDFCKSAEDDLVMPIWDGDLGSSLSSVSLSENTGIWVPQAPPPPLYPCQYTVISAPNLALGFGGQITVKNTKEALNLSKSTARKWRDDGCFTVPQIRPQSHGSKRSRIA